MPVAEINICFMKSIFTYVLVVCALLCGTSLMAQKAKFKNTKATCQKTRLPTNYVDPADRTYDLYVKGTYSENVEAYTKGIYGWKLNSEQPAMEAVISLYGFQVNPSKRSSEKKQTKDKEGNVTKSWTEYTYSGSARGKGTLYIYGQSNPFEYNKRDDAKSKAELAREEQEAAKKKELEANPFLSADDVADSEDAGESDIGEDSGLDDAMLPLVKTVGLDVTKSVKTAAYKSSSKAYEDYRNNQRPKLSSLRSSYPNASYNKALNALNAAYGYSPVNYSIYLKKMKSDKHPDFQMWNDATQAAQTLFKPVRYNKSIAGTQEKFAPIIEFFKGKEESIDDKDRKGKGLKKAAFNNVTNILFYLDKHDELIAYCESKLDSKFLDKAAKKMMNKAHRQQALMAFHKVESCHLETLEDSDDEDIESEDGDAEEDDIEGQR